MGNLSISSLINCGTKLYLDSIDPTLVDKNIGWGAVGATSNPIIVQDLLSSGRFDTLLQAKIEAGADDESIAWDLTDQLVRGAQEKFRPIWESSDGNEGWVSFELDPLIEDPALNLPHDTRVERYIELGRRWSAGHVNRMIKIPATPAGIDCLETLVAEGVTVNVTLVFTLGQYEQARNQVWLGAQRRASLEKFKSVYSIFVSRVDQFTAKHVPNLAVAQGAVGIVNAKRIWQANQSFWSEHPTALEQEIIFASTGTKDPADPPEKYVAALAGSDIQTNPPATNQAIADSEIGFIRNVDRWPAKEVLDEIDELVDFERLQDTLMAEGILKFAEPQRKLIASIAQRRRQIAH